MDMITELSKSRKIFQLTLVLSKFCMTWMLATWQSCAQDTAKRQRATTYRSILLQERELLGIKTETRTGVKCLDERGRHSRETARAFLSVRSFPLKSSSQEQ